MWMEGNTSRHSPELICASCSMFVCLVFRLFVCVFWSCIVEVSQLPLKTNCVNSLMAQTLRSGLFTSPVAEQTRKLNYGQTHTAQRKLSRYTSQRGRKQERIVRFNYSNSGVSVCGAADYRRVNSLIIWMLALLTLVTFLQLVIPRVNVWPPLENCPALFANVPVKTQRKPPWGWRNSPDVPPLLHSYTFPCFFFPNMSAVKNFPSSVRSLFRTLPSNIASATCDWN